MTFIIILLVVAALGIGGWLLRGYLTGEGKGAALLGNARDKRVGVVEQTAVDSKRKLVLIRRDGMEHLIMTGGPVDVVIETGITPQNRPAYERIAAVEQDRQPPGFARVRRPAVAQSGE